MGVLADRIEKFILEKLLEEQERMVILQRNELADELDCAPSQISYVLSTRFSNDRGYIVESRRGLGGFIRIAQLSSVDLEGTDNIENGGRNKTNQTSRDVQQEEEYRPLRSIGEIDNSLYLLMRHGAITQREAALMHEAFATVLSEVAVGKQGQAVQKLYNAMITVIKEG